MTDETAAMFSLAEQFDDLASGRAQRPRVDVEPADPRVNDEAKLRRLLEEIRSRRGPLFHHFLASVPYSLEELCRVGAALVDWFEGRPNDRDPLMVDLDAFDGTFARSVSAATTRPIQTLTCSPNPGNEPFFRAEQRSRAAFVAKSCLDLGEEDLPEAADVAYVVAALQFYGQDRPAHLKKLSKLVQPDGLFFVLEKCAAATAAEYDRLETIKDDEFKTQYFTRDEIAWKQREMLGEMRRGEISIDRLNQCLRTEFDHVELLWQGSNFYELVASNSEAELKRFLHLLDPVMIRSEYRTPERALSSV